MLTSQTNVASIPTDDITSAKLPNFENRTFWISDNLPILREIDDDVIDLIYLDPPFNSKRIYHAPRKEITVGHPRNGAAWQWPERSAGDFTIPAKTTRDSATDHLRRSL